MARRLLLAVLPAGMMPICGGLLALSPASAGDAPPAPAVPAPATTAPAPTTAPTAGVLITEGTEVHLILKEDLTSGRSKKGQTVRLEVAHDVWSADRHSLLIPSGAEAFGTVESSSGSGFLGRDGKLTFRCDYVLLAGGQHLPLRWAAAPEQRMEHGSTVVNAAVSVLPSPLRGVFSHGSNVSINRDEELIAEVAANTPLTGAVTTNAGTTTTTAVRGEGNPAPAAPPRMLFITRSGDTAIGTLEGTQDGVYLVNMGILTRRLKVSDVQGPYALAEPRQETGRKLLLKRTGQVFIGTITGPDNGLYTVTSAQGADQIREKDLKAIYDLAATG